MVSRPCTWQPKVLQDVVLRARMQAGFIVAEVNYTKCFKLLLEHGASINRQSIVSETSNRTDDAHSLSDEAHTHTRPHMRCVVVVMRRLVPHLWIWQFKS